MTQPPPESDFPRQRGKCLATRLAVRRKARALVRLLADDSPRVLGEVRAELTRLGRAARPALERAAREDRPGARGGSPGASPESATVRARARQLLLEGARKRALRRLTRFAAAETHDLERALLLLDAVQAPAENPAPTVRALDAMGAAVRKRIRHLAPGLARGMELVDYLSGELGFSGAEDDFHHPSNIVLRRTIERRRGMPLTVCAVYALVARRAGLLAALLPFPGHVLLRLSDGDERAIIDPFAGGNVLTEIHCLSYLADHGFPYRAEWFQGASDTAMFRRHVLNMIGSLRSRRRTTDARGLEAVHALLLGKGGSVPTIRRSLSGTTGRDGTDS